METFIARTNALLKARPHARVTTKFTHKKVHKKDDQVDPKVRSLKIVVKVFDPESGIVYKHHVHKVNELNRIMASLSPFEFDFDTGHKRGLASIMADHTAKQPEVTDAEKPKEKSKKPKKK